MYIYILYMLVDIIVNRGNYFSMICFFLIVFCYYYIYIIMIICNASKIYYAIIMLIV